MHKLTIFNKGTVKVVRNEETGVSTIEGYGSVFYDSQNPGTEYRISDVFVERIDRDAFSGIASDDVRCLWNHDENHVLGRTKNNTLRLSVDEHGLHYSCDLPDTQFANDLAKQIERGDIDGSSFGAYIRMDKTGFRYSKEGETTIRTILKVDRLLDVSPVAYPAFESTVVAISRSEKDAQEADAQLAEFEAQFEERQAEREATIRASLREYEILKHTKCF